MQSFLLMFKYKDIEEFGVSRDIGHNGGMAGMCK